MKKRGAVILSLLLLGAILLLGWLLLSREQETASQTSPTGRDRVVLVEKDGWIDRNFVVRLHKLGPDGGKASGVRTVFASPDEGRPAGSERFIWSEDGRWVLLVGRRFLCTREVRLNTGETAYLLYDVAGNRLFCNSEQQSAHAPFSEQDLRAIRFTEELLSDGGQAVRQPDRP